MKKIVLNGRSIVRGVAEGEALVTKDPITFAELDPKTGVLATSGELRDKSLTGKILVFPTGGFCTGGTYVLYESSRCGTAPLGLIIVKVDPISALGAILAKIPAIDRTDRNPFEVIETGDHVRMDADKGIIEVTKRS